MGGGECASVPRFARRAAATRDTSGGLRRAPEFLRE